MILSASLVLFLIPFAVSAVIHLPPSLSLSYLPNPYPLPFTEFLLSFERAGPLLPHKEQRKPYPFACIPIAINNLIEHVEREGNLPIHDRNYFRIVADSKGERSMCHIVTYNNDLVGWNDSVSCTQMLDPAKVVYANALRVSGDDLRGLCS